MASTPKRIRVLAADDSALMRRTLRRIIEADPQLELIDTARDGEDVVRKARELRPDVVSMDIHMPKLDGISALQILMAEDICPVVMLSSLTRQGAVTTFEALELGAFDCVAKPEGTVSDLGVVAQDLCRKLKAAGAAGTLSRLRRNNGSNPAKPTPRKPATPPVAAPQTRPNAASPDMLAVAIGISTGGPSTIQEVLPKIPANVGATFFLVQHMPASFTGVFARRLNENCELEVTEAEAGTEVLPGHCYVARGDLQLTVHRTMAGKIMLRTPSTPETLFRPSADVMMQSVLSVFGNRTIGVLMTGIGDDGAASMVNIKAAGGWTIAESEETAVVYGMPREAIERGGACEIRPDREVAAAIMRRL